MFDENVKSLWVINPDIIGKDAVFYGSGDVSHTFYRTLVRSGKVNLVGVFDENGCSKETAWGGTVPILSRKQLEELNKDTLIIVATDRIRAFQTSYQDLRNMGFRNILTRTWPAVPVRYDIDKSNKIIETEKDKIDTVRKLLCDERSIKVLDNTLKYRVTNDVNYLIDICEFSHKQYFPGPEIMKPDSKEVFLDVGCLNTLTIADLKEWTEDTYEKVYAFEPSRADRIVVDEYIEYMGYRAESVDAGLYNYTGEISFSSVDMGASRITEDGTDRINVVKLDDFMADKKEKVTFIKMDIEGSELEALEGSVDTIRKDYPKLAICVYHKFEDIWKLPLWVHDRFPDYSLFLRHYTMTNNETVMYAVPPTK